MTTGGAVTGADGRYQFAVKAPHDGSSVKLKARKAGYEVYRATLAAYAPAPAEILMTPVADWQLYYTVIYKGRGKKQIDAQGVVITGGGAKDTLLIKRNKGRTGKAVIMRVATDSSFARVYTEAPIARLEVTSGALKSLTAVGANVERILAGEIGTVRMTGAAIGDDGVTSAPAYAFTGIVAVSSSPLSANGRFLKPKIQTSAITIEGVALARQKARATISAGAKKLRAPDKKSWYVGYGGVSALLAGERHLRDMFMALDEQPDDLTLNIEARELASLSVTGGAIEGGDVEAQGVASVTAGGTAFTFKRAGGAKYGVFRQGNIAPRMISSGPLGKLLTVTAKGGDVRVGDPAQLTGSVAAGGVFSGGAVASVSAKLGGIRSPQGGVVAGGVVGFAPVVPAPADAGTSAPARWTWIESGVKDQSAGALHPDILSISGDVGVFGVFVAADDRTTTIPHPQASVRSIKTLKTAPGWAAGAQQTWWFSVAGEAYSLDPVKPDTKNSEGFRDELH
ncbi:MAG: hypothetical protein NTX50_08085 [Candidatus Sumerlaeota bacterium]|nr:hypothetical protein [Candidatus Sumerlaeota bacterium]